jgi:DNA-binding NarL/FixJ family response regulator
MIVVGDNDVATRKLAMGALDRAGFDALEADTGLGTLDASRRTGVEAVILEIMFPDMSGYEVCRKLRTEFGERLPIFFVSGTRTEPIDRVAGLLLGANDFIVKPFDVDELVARVRRFIERATAAPNRASPAADAPRLTRREHEVLHLLAEGRRQKEVGHVLSISSKTVGTHIQNLIRKFGVHSRAELVAHAYRNGVVTPRVGEPS